ncbi:MAG: carboxypeptidase M32 [Atopobiaceae bacterium]|nr:carboxypeptidase M32 [Atopobiaceae bacterium]
MEDDLALLAHVEQRLFAHRYASAELETFGETIDPKNATADRAEALAVLMEEDYELLSKDEVGGMLDRLGNRTDELEPVQQAQVRILKRDRYQLVSVPASDQAKLIRLASEGQDAWEQAKANNDWRSFAPYLDRLVNLQRKIARTKNPDADPYDTMLDEHEPGANRAFYNSFFARVKRCVIPLLTSISKSGRTLSRACVEGNFDVNRQWELAKDIARLEGINEDAHYLTSAEHPFSESMTSNYVVTAAHVHRDDLMSNVFTMLHEIGHNLYEQGVDPSLNRTSLSGGTSMGVHESQSRFFENYIGRDRAFCGPLLDLMKQRFPGQLSRVTPNQLYLAINRVVPSLIRMDADELTYPLHIIIRYEIEQLLFDGKATAREVPRLWADRYREYLGVEVTSDTMGALQDVHWSQGDFGYFPTYALGNAYAAQIRWKMIDEGMDWDRLLASGNLAPIRSWLQTHIWQYGRQKDPRELIEDACGEPFNPRHYANYLTNKYTALYGIR